MSTTNNQFDVIVIGGGQSGLSVGHHLKKKGLRFLILDGSARVGDAWRKRWDSLRLFTPTPYASLDGLPFPAESGAFPTKDEMADYLETYAAHFELPVLSGVRVDRLSKEGDGYRIQAGTRVYWAPQVVVAMSDYQTPQTPEFAKDLDTDLVQLHSMHYKSPAQLRPGPVLLVGAGNSGSEIAMELSKTHKVFMSGRSTGQVPFRIGSFIGRVLLVHLVLRVLFHRIFCVNNPIGRKVRPKLTMGGGPLIRVKAKQLAAAGVKRVGRTVGAIEGRPKIEGGEILEVSNVIWCTGFQTGFSWIDVPVIDQHGQPSHTAGVVKDAPGLYFVGLSFLYSLSSEMIHGVGRDAERIATLAATAQRAAADASDHRSAPPIAHADSRQREAS